MFQLTTSWHELIIRAVIVFLSLFVMLRFLGKKHLSEMGSFDFLLLLVISEAVEGSLLAGDQSITGGLMVVTTLLLLAFAFNWITFKSRRAEKIIDGIPQVIIRHGIPIHAVMEKERITLNGLLESCREEGVLKLSDVGLALLETNGKISVIKKEDGPGNFRDRNTSKKRYPHKRSFYGRQQKDFIERN